MTPKKAFEHCLEHGRNSELEKIILTNAFYAYSYAYARDVIKGIWIEAEKVISTDPFWIYLYAQNIIKGRLPENMHNMMLLYADKYAKKYLEFINKPPAVQ